MNSSFFDQFALAIEEQKGVMKDLEEKNRELHRHMAEREGKTRELSRQVVELEGKKRELSRQVVELEGKEREWHQHVVELEEKKRELSRQVVEGEGKTRELSRHVGELEEKNREVHRQVVELEGKEREWHQHVVELEEKNRALHRHVADLKAGRGIFLDVCGTRFTLQHQTAAMEAVAKVRASNAEVLSRPAMAPEGLVQGSQEYARACMFFEDLAGEEVTARPERTVQSRQDGVKRGEMDEAQQAVLRRELVGSYILD